MSMFVPMDSPVTFQPTPWAHTNNFLGIFLTFFGFPWHFPHSQSLLTLITLSSLSLSSHSRCLLHMLFEIIFFFVHFLSSRALCMSMSFVLTSFLLYFGFAYGYNNWLIFCEVGLAIALHSLCFVFYVWLQQSQLDFCLHFLDFYLWLQQSAWLLSTIATINSCFVSFCLFQIFGGF